MNYFRLNVLFAVSIAITTNTLLVLRLGAVKATPLVIIALVSNA